MDIYKLQELCPEWDISRNKLRIYIKSKYFNTAINVFDKILDNIIDVYNSIEILTEFLINN